MKTAWLHYAICVGLLLSLLAACTSVRQVTTTHELSDDADAPYDRVLLLTLFESFDSRRYLEQEVIKLLPNGGEAAVASTSIMDTRSPMTRKEILRIIEEIDADALLVTQIASLHATATRKDMRPEATTIFRPTWYYNVWSVETTEYVEPPSYDLDHEMILLTEMFSVKQRELVWSIKSESWIHEAHDKRGDYSVYIDEANAIAKSLVRDGLIRSK